MSIASITCKSLELYDCPGVSDEFTGLPTITVQLTHNNTHVFRLMDSGTPVALDTLYNIKLVVNDTLVIWSTTYPTYIWWNTGAEPPGIVHLALGRVAVLANYGCSTYNTSLFTYDIGTPQGFYWGDFRLKCMDNGDE